MGNEERFTLKKNLNPAKYRITGIIKVILLLAALAACAEKNPKPMGDQFPVNAAMQIEAGPKTDISADLGRIAEIERAGGFFPGLALAESAIREKAGDLSGAAVAAYKELSWAYGYGSVSMVQIEEGLQNALKLLGDDPSDIQSERNYAVAVLKGCMAFAGGEYELAEKFLAGAYGESEEADSFLRWMLLVCALEQKNTDPEKFQENRSVYGAIRARYALFPEYWYRGAQAFLGGDDVLSSSYAEQCINVCPQGPFAGKSRKILALNAGLTDLDLSLDGESLYAGIRTKAEIENIVHSSVSINDPALLEDLFPLISLPENPYTVYALGAMKTLSSAPLFLSFFTEASAKSRGRLGERLNYISRG